MRERVRYREMGDGRGEREETRKEKGEKTQ